MRKELTRRNVLIAAAASSGAGFLPWAARAQAWPARPVTLVVPYGPGASNDIFTRALGEILSKKFNQPFVVENRPGAGGFSGTLAVSRSAPDGYTFLEIPNSVAGFKPGMKVDLDPLTHLTPIGTLARAPTALVVNASLPISTTAEFVAYCRANPASTYYGYAGIGTAQHQHMEMFAQATGIKPRGVNYKSSADAQLDLVAGRTQAMIITVASTIGQIQSGQLRLLSYTNNSYPATSPKAPTMAEAGVPGMEKAQSWWGVFGPAGMSADLVKIVNSAINEAIADPSFVALLAKSGATPAPSTPEQFIGAIKEEVEMVDAFFKTLNK